MSSVDISHNLSHVSDPVILETVMEQLFMFSEAGVGGKSSSTSVALFRYTSIFSKGIFLHPIIQLGINSRREVPALKAPNTISSYGNIP